MGQLIDTWSNRLGEHMAAFDLGFFAIPVTDLAIAKKFYGSVMGWEFNDRDADFSYILAGEEMIGALEVASPKFRPSDSGPLLYFRADFMAKTLARVTDNGGVILENLAMEGGARGFTARISDLSKNTIGFWAPEN